jgi:hypothetical protein
MTRDHLEHICLDGRIILKRILKNYKVLRVWTGFMWFRTASSDMNIITVWKQIGIPTT